jgi:hypothetical protein
MRAVKGREVYLFNDGIYWVLNLFSSRCYRYQN